MTTLTAWKFDITGGAEEASRTLQDLARAHLVVIHDAATVVWEEDQKKPRTHQLACSAGGAMGGSFWGLLFGMIFFVPLLGAAIGTATGALAGSLTDVGIDDVFVNRVRDQITPGTSALFVIAPESVVDRVHEAFAGHRPAELMFTHLSQEQEAALREVFAAD